MEFKEVSKAEWLKKVEKDLKGKPLSSLDWEPAPGLVVSPFAHAEDATGPHEALMPHRASNAWIAGVVLDATDLKEANRSALALLNNGAGALKFLLNRSLSTAGWATLLDGIRADWIELHLACSVPEIFIDLGPLAEHLRSAGQNPTDIRGSVSASTRSLDHFPGLVAGYLAAETLHNTDAQIAEEMQQIRQGLQRLAVVNPARTICIGLQASDHYLLSIAKFRAVRRLWQQLVGSSENLLLHAYIGPFAPDTDEHTNKIRATTRCMAAVVGGADTVFVYPSDATSATDGSDFNRRISLNIQHLLQLESYLDREVDPAAGSYYLEGLTERLLALAG